MRPSQGIHRLAGGWVVIITLLSAIPITKAGELQSVEILQACRLILVGLAFAYAGFPIPTGGVWRDYGRGFLAFLLLALALALLALRLPFFPPPGIPMLKQPLILSIARIGELFLDIYFMLALADTFRRRRDLLLYALNTYWIVGAVSAALSVFSYLLFKATGVMLYFVYGLDVRVRGFFNEAGPYGIFLVSVILVLQLRDWAFPGGWRQARRAALVLLVSALFLTSSKAGFMTLAALLAVAGVFAARVRQRLLVMAGSAAACLLIWVLLGDRFAGYVRDFSSFEETVMERSDDPSLVMGRIVAMLIVPRIIAEHPVTGIGIGNYSLMRNNPEYLQQLPAVTEWDLPGLGLLGSAAELGLPLISFLLVLFLAPLFRARLLRAPLSLLLVAAFQPVALLAGVNLNFFYHWLMASFAIACIGSMRPKVQAAIE